jgi:uncharacterized protein YndB with AHSA1/START domain
MNHHVYLATVPGQRLVNTVIDQLKHHVVQAGAIIRIANVHAWALAHRIEAF